MFVFRADTLFIAQSCRPYHRAWSGPSPAIVLKTFPGQSREARLDLAGATYGSLTGSWSCRPIERTLGLRAGQAVLLWHPSPGRVTAALAQWSFTAGDSKAVLCD